VNGRAAVQGQVLDPAVDRVTLDGKRVTLAGRPTYLLLNKPPGMLTTVTDDRGRPTVLQAAGVKGAGLFPVGRLDMNSRGMVLLTDDGEMAYRLMHPRYHVEKEYRVTVSGRPAQDALRRLERGLQIGAERFQPATVRILRSKDSTTELTMVLREGRKREIRRMFLALQHRVLDLERVRIGPLRLGRLKAGTARGLRPAEVEQLRSAVGLAE
jgi:pseudouridine synthase